MYKVFLMTVAACLLMANAALAEVKVGVVDMQVVATDSDPAKKAQEEMKAKYGAERDSLEKQTKDLQKLADSFKGPNIPEEKRMDFIRKRRTLDEKTRDFTTKVERDEIKIRQDMVTLVFRAAYEVAQRKGFNFVVDVTAGGVLYAEQNMDLTKDVLEEVNKLWKDGGSKEALPSSPEKADPQVPKPTQQQKKK